MKNVSFVQGRDELQLGLAHIESDEIRKDIVRDGVMNQALDRLDTSLKIVRCGYLWKMSSTGATEEVGGEKAAWHRRWFVLRADACLYFFKGRNVRKN